MVPQSTNTAIGYSALMNPTTGSNNIAFGSSAGGDIFGRNNRIFTAGEVVAGITIGGTEIRNHTQIENSTIHVYAEQYLALSAPIISANGVCFLKELEELQKQLKVMDNRIGELEDERNHMMGFIELVQK